MGTTFESDWECSRLKDEIATLRQRVQELTAERDELLAAAVMAVEMIEYEKHERRHVRWKLNDAIASVKEKQNAAD